MNKLPLPKRHFLERPAPPNPFANGPDPNRFAADLAPVVRAVLDGYALDPNGIHGLAHWARVLDNAVGLAGLAGVDPRVPALFAVLHDACRLSDNDDPYHGRRAAAFAGELRGRGLMPGLSDADFDTLSRACAGHADGGVTDDPTVGACWDADRLDLGRVGIAPRPALLCTAAARTRDVLTWSHRRAAAGFVPAELLAPWTERGPVEGDAGDWLGWYWCGGDRRLSYPPFTPIFAGQTLTETRPLALRETGLHASRLPLDAMRHVPPHVFAVWSDRPAICRVRLHGEIIEGDYEACASNRTVLWVADARIALHEFALAVADRELAREAHCGRDVPPAITTALDVKRRWLRGDATGVELRTLYKAAFASIGTAAHGTVPSAAWSAIVSACYPDAAHASHFAAEHSAHSTTYRAYPAGTPPTWDEAWGVLNDDLARRLLTLAPTGRTR